MFFLSAKRRILNNNINFFSVDNRFAEQDGLTEFCEMVDALHEAGLEVFLDVRDGGQNELRGDNAVRFEETQLSQ